MEGNPTVLAIALVLGIGFIWLGFVITKKKYHRFISGYSTHSKKNIPSKVLSSLKLLLIGIGVFLILGLGLLSSLGHTLTSVLITLNGIFILFIIHLCFTIKYQEINQRISLVVVISILLAVLVLFNYQLNIYTKEVSVRLIDDYLIIESIPNQKIPLKDIQQVMLQDTKEVIKSKNFGFALGHIKKGYFLLENGADVYFYLNSEKLPYLKIISPHYGTFYLNYNPNNITHNTLLEIGKP